MAEFCEKCFVKEILSSKSQELYKKGLFLVELSTSDEVCDGCGKQGPIVLGCHLVGRGSSKSSMEAQKIKKLAQQNNSLCLRCMHHRRCRWETKMVKLESILGNYLFTEFEYQPNVCAENPVEALIKCKSFKRKFKEEKIK